LHSGLFNFFLGNGRDLVFFELCFEGSNQYALSYNSFQYKRFLIPTQRYYLPMRWLRTLQRLITPGNLNMWTLPAVEGHKPGSNLTILLKRFLKELDMGCYWLPMLVIKLCLINFGLTTKQIPMQMAL